MKNLLFEIKLLFIKITIWSMNKIIDTKEKIIMPIDEHSGKSFKIYKWHLGHVGLSQSIYAILHTVFILIIPLFITLHIYVYKNIYVYEPMNLTNYNFALFGVILLTLTFVLIKGTLGIIKGVWCTKNKFEHMYKIYSKIIGIIIIGIIIILVLAFILINAIVFKWVIFDIVNVASLLASIIVTYYVIGKEWSEGNNIYINPWWLKTKVSRKDSVTDLNQYLTPWVLTMLLLHLWWFAAGILLFIIIFYILTIKWTTP